MSVFALITSLLQAATGFFRWQAAEARLKHRRALIDEQDKIDRETDELQEKLDAAWADARNSGSSDKLRLVDRLRDRLAQRQEFAVFVATGISDLATGGNDPNDGGELSAVGSGSVGVGKEVSAGGTTERESEGGGGKAATPD